MLVFLYSPEIRTLPLRFTTLRPNRATKCNGVRQGQWCCAGHRHPEGTRGYTTTWLDKLPFNTCHKSSEGVLLPESPPRVLCDPCTVTIPQYWFNKTKQHTPSLHTVSRDIERSVGVWKDWIRLEKELATLSEELPPVELLPAKRKKQSPDTTKRDASREEFG